MGAIWKQWFALGTRIHSESPARSMVDPEALLLTSLALHQNEKRLWDILTSWAKHGSKLFSLQRVKNLQDSFPENTKNLLAQFAHRAHSEGSDFRWQSMSENAFGPESRDSELWTGYPSKWPFPALVLRMRLGFGVGISADLLSYLITQRGDWVRAKQASLATSYSTYAIRRVADDLVAAQFIESTQGKPIQYRVGKTAWVDALISDKEAPDWCYWHQVYSFATNLINSNETKAWDGLSPYLLSTHLRDHLETNQDVFILNRIETPDLRNYPGEALLPAFGEVIGNLSQWIENNV